MYCGFGAHIFLSNNTNPLNQILMKYHINQVSIQTYTSFTSDILNEAAVGSSLPPWASSSFSPEFQQPAGWRPFFGSPVKNKEFRKEIRERLPSSVMTPAKNLFDKSDHNFSKAKMMLIAVAQWREQRRLTYCWFFFVA